MDNIETDMSEMLITLTADIVSAHVSYNDVRVSRRPRPDRQRPRSAFWLGQHGSGRRSAA